MLTPAEAQIKRLKLIGWIGGGTLVAVGTIMIGVGISNGYSGEKAYTSTYTYEGKTYSHYFPGVSGFTDWGLIAPGMVALAGGIATTTGCLVKAHKLMQQSPYSVNASPLYRQEFRLKNGASLATGVDFLKDNTRHNPTLGIGLSYNF